MKLIAILMTMLLGSPAFAAVKHAKKSQQSGKHYKSKRAPANVGKKKQKKKKSAKHHRR